MNYTLNEIDVYTTDAFNKFMKFLPKPIRKAGKIEMLKQSSAIRFCLQPLGITRLRYTGIRKLFYKIAVAGRDITIATDLHQGSRHVTTGTIKAQGSYPAHTFTGSFYPVLDSMLTILKAKQ